MIPMAPANPDDDVLVRASSRIAWLTLFLGFAAAIATFFIKSHRAAAGVAIGTLLAWLNYRWLDQALGTLVTVATAQEGSAKARVPSSIYWKFAGRYVLIGLAVYVSVHYFAVPVLAVIAGLLALGAGAIAEGLYEVFSGSA
jgi:hypothetical protein